MADKSNEKKTLLNLLDRIADALEESAEQSEESAEKPVIKKTLLNLLDRIAVAFENAEPVLPEVTSDDNGDVLAVVEGEWGKASPSGGLPDVTTDDNGDVLTVVEGAWGKATPSGGLPAVTSTDNGKVLSVVQGNWQAKQPTDYTFLQYEVFGDGETPETFNVGDMAVDVYGACLWRGVVFGGHLVVDATATYDENTGNTSYTFTVITVKNGTVSAIIYTADSDEDYPHYTES